MGRLTNTWKALTGELTPPPEPKASPLSEVERASSPPPFFAAREQRLGLTEGISPAQLLAQFRGWQAIASNAIADEVMAIKPFVAVQRMRENGVVQEERLDQHPLKELLDHPSPNFSRMTLLRLLALWLTQVGDAYLLKITDDLGVVRQLEPLNPKDMDLVAERTGITGYVYRSPHSGEEIAYGKDEVIRIYKPDPECPFRALGNLSPQAISYDTSLFMDQTLRKHFRDDATPKVAIKAQENSQLPSPEDRKRWERDWIHAYNRRIGDTAGVPSMLPPGFDVHEFELWSGKDLIPLLEHYRDKILAANGVPGSIVGLVQDVNRAAAETNMFVFESTTIKPLADLIADALTNQLARDFDPRLVIRFEDFITTDKSFELEKNKSLLQHKVVSINEIRVEVGREPASWGDLPVGTAQEVPYTGEIVEPAMQPQESPPTEAEEDDASPREADDEGEDT